MKYSKVIMARLILFFLSQIFVLLMIYTLVPSLSDWSSGEKITYVFFSYPSISSSSFFTQVSFLVSNVPQIIFYGTLFSSYYSSEYYHLKIRIRPSHYFLLCDAELLLCAATSAAAIWVTTASIKISESHCHDWSVITQFGGSTLLFLFIYFLSSFSCLLFINGLSYIFPSKLKVLGSFFALILLLLPFAIADMFENKIILLFFPYAGKLVNYVVLHLFSVPMADFSCSYITNPRDYVIFIIATLCQIIIFTVFLIRRTQKSDIL